MNVRPKTREHHYAAFVEWTGASSGATVSYASYSRTYRVTFAGKPPLEGSADATFRGDPETAESRKRCCSRRCRRAICCRIRGVRPAGRARERLRRRGGRHDGGDRRRRPLHACRPSTARDDRVGRCGEGARAARARARRLLRRCVRSTSRSRSRRASSARAGSTYEARRVGVARFVVARPSRAGGAARRAVRHRARWRRRLDRARDRKTARARRHGRCDRPRRHRRLPVCRHEALRRCAMACVCSRR